MRCGPDHHTVNFLTGKKTKMHHIAFEVKDFAQIQNCLRTVRAEGDPDHLGAAAPRAGA